VAAAVCDTSILVSQTVMPPRPLSSCVRLAAHGGRTARPEKYSASAENPVRFPEDLGLDFRLSSKILRILCMPGATAARSPLDHAAIACTGTAASPAMQLGGSGRARARAPIDRSARGGAARRGDPPRDSHIIVVALRGPAQPPCSPLPPQLLQLVRSPQWRRSPTFCAHTFPMQPCRSLPLIPLLHGCGGGGCAAAHMRSHHES
jgi:hypothetical protein